MSRMPWAVYIWPGLPQMAHRGSWAALALALASAVLLNLALVATFVWTDLIVRELRIICWVFLGVSWSVSAGYSAWWQHRHERRQSEPRNDLFTAALESYLKGNWIEAERSLGDLLHHDSHDIEARLMLATLLRHTHRLDEATRQLNHLARMDGAQAWAMEIRREGELLTDARMRNITSTSSVEVVKANDGEN